MRPALGAPRRECCWPPQGRRELYVVPEQRGRGIGSALLKAAEEVVRARDGRVLEINVDGDDVAARRFYERHGYRNSEPGTDEQNAFTTSETYRPDAMLPRSADLKLPRTADRLGATAGGTDAFHRPRRRGQAACAPFRRTAAWRRTGGCRTNPASAATERSRRAFRPSSSDP